MYLSQLQLTNFRSFSEEKVSFERRLTVLVGENNSGKSNLIDAIRLVSTPLSGRRELYCEAKPRTVFIVPEWKLPMAQPTESTMLLLTAWIAPGVKSA